MERKDSETWKRLQKPIGAVEERSWASSSGQVADKQELWILVANDERAYCWAVAAVGLAQQPDRQQRWPKKA
jgi:hypothetical protein